MSSKFKKNMSRIAKEGLVISLLLLLDLTLIITRSTLTLPQITTFNMKTEQESHGR